MKSVIALVSLLFAQNVLAETLLIESCREAEIEASTIVEMRSFSNGQIKLFAHDLGEPINQPVGIQITYVRGSEDTNMENFCVYVRGLSDVSLKNATAQYDPGSNTLYVQAPGRRFLGSRNDFGPTVVSLTIRKEGRRAANIFSASAR